MEETQQAVTAPVAQAHDGAAPPESVPKKSSGYRRLQARHRSLIAEKEALQRDYYALLDQQASLQRDVDNLLAQHQKLMKASKSPSAPAAWFDGANLTLAQLAADPDPRAVQIFVAALAQLQSRLSPIVARTPLA
jgi:hypothetical protein